VLVVEHDEETIRRADHVVDLGSRRRSSRGLRSRARHSRGHRPKSRVADRPVHRGVICRSPFRRSAAIQTGKAIAVLGARANNLKNIDVTFPSDCS